MSQRFAGGGVSEALRRLNNRHPWSHNDAFHAWIATGLPDSRGEAVDVGCGRGELVALLAQHFDHVRGIDVDAEMRRVSSARCAGLANVTIDSAMIDELPVALDLVTMIAVLHHLELEDTLERVRAVLGPGGRFLCVGLARPDSFVDHTWDLASMVSNPIIGYIRHPWAARQPPGPPPFPVRDPDMTFGQIKTVVRRVLPGAEMRRHLGFRYTIEWTKS